MVALLRTAAVVTIWKNSGRNARRSSSESLLRQYFMPASVLNEAARTLTVGSIRAGIKLVCRL